MNLTRLLIEAFPMVIGGLDIATTSGYASISGDHFKVGKWSPVSKTEGSRVLELQRNIRQWILMEQIDFVGIEAPIVMVNRTKKVTDEFGATYDEAQVNNPRTAMVLYGYNMAAQSVCEDLGVPWKHIAVATHRKAFLGAGRIPKGKGKELTLVQCQRMGVAVKSKDAADAFSVAWAAAGICKQNTFAGLDLLS